MFYSRPLTINAMFTHSKRYQKLKQAATRLMVAGDVERYLHALRLMSNLRTQPLAGRAS